MAVTVQDLLDRHPDLFGEGAPYKLVSLFSASGGRRANVICEKHGAVDTALRSIHRKVACHACGKESQGGARQTLEEFTRKIPASLVGKYDYVELVYPAGRNRALVRYTCPSHGLQEQDSGNHLSGHGCRLCANESNGLMRQLSIEEYEDKCPTDLKSNLLGVVREDGKVFYKFLCPEHGEYRQWYMDAVNGYRCAGCKPPPVAVSKPNLELAEFFESLGCSVVKEFHLQNKYRFDLLVDGHLLVEYNGLYWHSTQYREPGAHAAKQKLGESAGCRVIQVFSDEWAERREQVKRLLAIAVGRLEQPKAQARKCKLVKVSREAGDAFMDAWHVQGPATGGEYIGLEADGVLVAVANHGPALAACRTRSAEIGELRRYASSCAVLGGLGKLSRESLKHYKSLVSFSDVRLFSGQAYQKAGFKLQGKLAPDYSYVVRDSRRHKSGFQKSRLIKLFGSEVCEGKTEKQITEAAKLYRVYDCGKLRWVM